MSETVSVSEAVALAIRRRPLALLFLVCLIAWLPGFFTIPPLDRDESRFAQASKQMLETGNFVDIRFGHEPRYKKPVGIYWLQAGATAVVDAVSGNTVHGRIWTYRIPSLAGAFAAVALTFWCGRAFLGVEGAFFGGLLLGLTLLLSAECKIAKTDAVLLASVVGTQAVLLRAYLASRTADEPPIGRNLALLGWAFFALGILIKGPVILGVCAVTIVVIAIWDLEYRWLGQLRPYWGIALTLLIVLPWMIAIALQSHGAFYQQSLGHDFGAKLAGGQETHGAPPGYYVLLTTVSFWPATLFLVPALALAVARRTEPAVRFLVAWAGGSFLLFELVPTKLPHYILPAYPALALLGALLILQPRSEVARRWQTVSTYFAVAQFLLGTALLAAGPLVLMRLYGSGFDWPLLAAAIVIGLVGASAAVLMIRGTERPALACAAICAVMVYAALTLGTIPRLEQLWVSPRAAVAIASHMRPGDPPPVLAGYTEPSLVFLLGTETRLTNGNGAAETGAAQGGLALIEDGQRRPFLEHLAELDASAAPVDALSGFNYSRGRKVHLTLYRMKSAYQITLPPQE